MNAITGKSKNNKFNVMKKYKKHFYLTCLNN